MEPKHTPTPWHFIVRDEYDKELKERVVLAVDIYQTTDVDKDSTRVGGITVRPNRDAIANAAYIVRAVNCHEELLEASKAALYHLSATSRPNDPILAALDKAIAKAEGK